MKQNRTKPRKIDRSLAAGLAMLALLCFCAVFAGFLANNAPLYAKIQGRTYWPAFAAWINNTAGDSVPVNGAAVDVTYRTYDWRQLEMERVVWPMIAYTPDFLDRYNRDYTRPGGQQRYKDVSGQVVDMPFRLRHYLGTDGLGRDIAAGVVHGCAWSLQISIMAMAIALVIGLLGGAATGYRRSIQPSMPVAQLIGLALGSVLGFYYGFICRQFALADAGQEGLAALLAHIIISIAIMAVATVAFGWLGKLLARKGIGGRKLMAGSSGPMLFAANLTDSLPRLLLIITLAAVIGERSLWIAAAVIGITGWTAVARLSRAEFLGLSQRDYVSAVRGLGFSDTRIVFRHMLPNAAGPLLVLAAFGMAGAIMAEAGLSFLGLGVPPEVVTWGSIISAGRFSFDAWWMIVFPGLAILWAVMSFNLIAAGISRMLDNRLQ